MPEWKEFPPKEPNSISAGQFYGLPHLTYPLFYSLVAQGTCLLLAILIDNKIMMEDLLSAICFYSYLHQNGARYSLFSLVHQIVVLLLIVSEGVSCI